MYVMTQVNGEIRIEAFEEQVREYLASLAFVSGSGRRTPAWARAGVNGDLGVFRPTTPANGAADAFYYEDADLETYRLEGNSSSTFARTRLTLRPDGGDTILAVSVEYKTKFGPDGSLADRRPERSKVEEEIAFLLAGLKGHIEAGRAYLPSAGTYLPPEERQALSA